jgi:hypothetical protein
MPTSWNSLFWPSSDAVTIAAHLRESLTALGYELFNPFGLIPGKAYAQAVRLFVAPALNGWVKVIGQPDERQLPQLSQHGLFLYLALNGAKATITAYQDGNVLNPASALQSYLKPRITPSDLRQALEDPLIAKISPLDSSFGGVPMEVLPDEVQSMARQVNPKQAQQLISRLGGDLLKRTGGEEQAAAARALIDNHDQPDWNSHGGVQIRALMHCLDIPSNWREPEFITLRDAYQLHERKRRNPNARAYPGDDDVMALVPDALAFIPVYGGMKA